MKTINPFTEELIKEYSLQSPAEIEQAITRSQTAFASWRKTSLDDRLKAAVKFSMLLKAERPALGELMTREMGKTLKESQSEIDKCVTSVAMIAEHFPRWRSELCLDVGQGFHVSREPLGVLLGIMPWNFPLWQVVRFAVPAMLCGNTVLLKHAPNTWGSAEFIAQLFARAFPTDLYINLRIDVPAVEKILSDFRVRGVSLTGSRRAGMSVAGIAGSQLKKCVLELGGSDAYVILDDADLDLAADVCVRSRLLNNGQSCVAAKRFIVTKKNSVSFTDKMLRLMQTKKSGDPMIKDTDIGPLARTDLRDTLHTQVERSVDAGAVAVLGGTLPGGRGYFYPPTLLKNVKPGQPAFDEELFGPVAAVIEASDEAQALAFANQSRYGLGGAIFSRDVQRASALARAEMEAGMVFVNDLVRSDWSVPFGGVKDSGVGRELGRDGCFEFTNVKTLFAGSLKA